MAGRHEARDREAKAGGWLAGAAEAEALAIEEEAGEVRLTYLEEDAVEAEKNLVELLAKAWLAEAKRLRVTGSCDCGCGGKISARPRFQPGHDAKLLKRYRADIRDILSRN